MMVNSNSQREIIQSSEHTKACRILLEAVKQELRSLAAALET